MPGLGAWRALGLAGPSGLSGLGVCRSRGLVAPWRLPGLGARRSLGLLGACALPGLRACRGRGACRSFGLVGAWGVSRRGACRRLGRVGAWGMPELRARWGLGACRGLGLAGPWGLAGARGRCPSRSPLPLPLPPSRLSPLAPPLLFSVPLHCLACCPCLTRVCVYAWRLRPGQIGVANSLSYGTVVLPSEQCGPRPKPWARATQSIAKSEHVACVYGCCPHNRNALSISCGGSTHIV